MEHYILKGVTDALFLDFRNYHNRITVKNIAQVTPRGVYIRLRSVLRGFVASGTLYGVSICLSVVVSLSVYRYGCGRPRKSSRQM